MSCRLFLKNCQKVVRYASKQHSISGGWKMPYVQFSDYISCQTQDCENILSEKQRSSNDMTVKAWEERNAAAEMYLNSLTEEMEKKRRRIELIIEALRMQNKMVPERFSALDMKIMLTETAGSRKSVQRYCGRMYKKDSVYMKKKLQKEQKQEERQKQLEKRINVGIGDNTLSLHHAMRQIYEKKWQKIRTLLHGSPVIVDLNYDLKIREENIAYSDLETFLGWNLNSLNPLLLQFTSVHRSSVYSSLIESTDSNNVAAEFYQEHFTELYPKEKLIYLSPDGKPFSKQFDRQKIYIVGGCVDKYSHRPKESYMKAAELGIECRSFPVQSYFKIRKQKQMHTNFSIDVSLKILQDVLQSGNWEAALQAHISHTFEPLSRKVDERSNRSRLLGSSKKSCAM